MPTHALLRPALLLTLLTTLLTALLTGLLAGLPAAPASAAPPAPPAAAPAAAVPAAALAGAARPALALPSAGPRLVAEAATHRGKPYRWGATGPARFDCSGFVRYVYARLGKALPRTSGQQYAATRRVAQADKQLGDLIFTRSSTGRIDHVGIYAGAGTFWVAPRAGDVVKRQRIYTSRYSVGRV